MVWISIPMSLRHSIWGIGPGRVTPIRGIRRNPRFTIRPAPGKAAPTPANIWPGRGISPESKTSAPASSKSSSPSEGHINTSSYYFIGVLAEQSLELTPGLLSLTQHDLPPSSSAKTSAPAKSSATAKASAKSIGTIRIGGVRSIAIAGIRRCVTPAVRSTIGICPHIG